jgi:hypothetical protein
MVQALLTEVKTDDQKTLVKNYPNQDFGLLCRAF